MPIRCEKAKVSKRDYGGIIMRIERRKNRSISQIIRDRKEAKFYVSKGATLIKEKQDEWHFDHDEIRNMKLEWKLKLNKN